MHAVKIDTGEVLWTYSAAGLQRRPRDASEELRDEHRPVSGAGGDRRRGDRRQPRWIPARVRCEDGEVLFQFDTARTFEAVNGVEAKGGSIDAASITAANGYLFVNSGYGMSASWRGMCCWRSR
jgi:polyvinyl alcohol dehydrogenase (cytochrome)